MHHRMCPVVGASSHGSSSCKCLPSSPRLSCERFAKACIACSSRQRPTSSLAHGSTTTATAPAAGTSSHTATRSAISHTSSRTLGGRSSVRCRARGVEEDTALFEQKSQKVKDVGSGMRNTSPSEDLLEEEMRSLVACVGLLVCE